MSDNIEQQVIKIVAETLKIEEGEISTASKFIDDLGADSLDLAELMMAIEAAFECDIPDEDAGKISTIQDAIDYVKEKTAA